MECTSRHSVEAPFCIFKHDLNQVITGLWERAGGIKRSPSATTTTFEILHPSEALLLDLQKACGYGFVSKKPVKRGMFSFTVTHRHDVVKAIDSLRGNMRFEHKRCRIEEVIPQIKSASPKTVFLSNEIQKTPVKTVANASWLIAYNSKGGKPYKDYALPVETVPDVCAGAETSLSGKQEMPCTVSDQNMQNVLKRLHALSLQEFAHYLAGYLDANGHIEKRGYISMSMHANDVTLAKAIQHRIGAGDVRLVKGNKTAVYHSRKEGMVYIAWLVKGRLHHPVRVEQLHSRVLSRPHIQKEMARYGTPPPILPPFESHWFAGFSEGDVSFVIKSRHTGRCDMTLEIEQVEPRILDMVQSAFGRGSRWKKVREQGFAPGRAIGVWGSSNLQVNLACIAYFDTFSCIGQKYMEFLSWRAGVKLTEKGHHLDPAGMHKLLSLQATLSRMRKQGTPGES